MILRGSRSAGYGFVALATEEAAKKAVEALDKKELEGRPVIVEIAKPSDQKDKERKEKKAKRKAGKRGSKAASGEASESNGEGAAPAEGAATEGTDEAAKPKKKKKNAVGVLTAYLLNTFDSFPFQRKNKAKAATSEDGAEAASPAEGETTDGAPKKARKAKTPRPKRPAGEDPVGEPSKTMLFVANLGFNIDDDGLKALFTEAGVEVVSARIVRMHYGNPRRSKGYGFVDVGSEQEQQKGIAALEGKDVGGRNIAVKVAVNPPPQEEGAAGDASATTPATEAATAA